MSKNTIVGLAVGFALLCVVVLVSFAIGFYFIRRNKERAEKEKTQKYKSSASHWDD